LASGSPPFINTENASYISTMYFTQFLVCYSNINIYILMNEGQKLEGGV
jgi:hypothetical protein